MYICISTSGSYQCVVGPADKRVVPFKCSNFRRIGNVAIDYDAKPAFLSCSGRLGCIVTMVESVEVPRMGTNKPLPSMAGCV